MPNEDQLREQRVCASCDGETTIYANYCNFCGSRFQEFKIVPEFPMLNEILAYTCLVFFFGGLGGLFLAGFMQTRANPPSWTGLVGAIAGELAFLGVFGGFWVTERQEDAKSRYHRSISKYRYTVEGGSSDSGKSIGDRIRSNWFFLAVILPFVIAVLSSPIVGYFGLGEYFGLVIVVACLPLLISMFIFVIGKAVGR